MPKIDIALASDGKYRPAVLESQGNLFEFYAEGYILVFGNLTQGNIDYENKQSRP
jgi:hypothetical protein